MLPLLLARWCCCNVRVADDAPPSPPPDDSLPRLIRGRVLLIDAIWVPSEHRLVFLALTPDVFRLVGGGGGDAAPRPRGEFHAFNHSFDSELLEHPCALLRRSSSSSGAAAVSIRANGHALDACDVVRVASNDPNVDDTLFIGSFALERRAVGAAARESGRLSLELDGARIAAYVEMTWNVRIVPLNHCK